MHQLQIGLSGLAPFYSLVTSRFILRWLVLLSALIPDNNRQDVNRPVIRIFHNQA